jgi:hypothetical protein
MYTAVPHTTGRNRKEPAAVRGHRVANALAGNPAGDLAGKRAANLTANLTKATASNLTTKSISITASGRSRSTAP